MPRLRAQRPHSLILLVAALLGVGLLTPPATSAAPAGPARAHLAPSYRNPLKLELPSGARAESCADPSVLKGHGTDRHWYLYCTSDALRADELGPDGKPLLHNVP